MISQLKLQHSQLQDNTIWVYHSKKHKYALQSDNSSKTKENVFLVKIILLTYIDIIAKRNSAVPGVGNYKNSENGFSRLSQSPKMLQKMRQWRKS